MNPSFYDINLLGQILLEKGRPVDTGHWQALKNVPHTKSIELMNVVYQLGIPETHVQLADIVKPNLPWAEDHFQERVAGEPTNPGDQYMNWPWYHPDWEAQKQREFDPDCPEPGYAVNTAPSTFSHTYQERMWPRSAGDRGPALDEWVQSRPNQVDRMGIRFRYGDLEDVAELLTEEPHTRQAYLPIWFPEDTGAHHGERVPCTLGYHFLLRDDKLHINYFIRSCDFLRYFRDDVYMASRLCQWMLGRLQISSWSDDVVPGTLTMFISSLHIFEGDLPKMRKEYG